VPKKVYLIADFVGVAPAANFFGVIDSICFC